jgi:hypothetical protein
VPTRRAGLRGLIECWNVGAIVNLTSGAPLRLLHSHWLADAKGKILLRNVFNHPTPGDPNLNIKSGTFGEISSKTGSRKLQGQIHFQF